MRCSRCGVVNAPKGALKHSLQMEGLTPSPKLFRELMRAWRGFTLTGEEADEGLDELVRVPKLMNLKNYVSPPRLRSSEPINHELFRESSPIEC